MPKDKKIKQRAQALKEAEDLAKQKKEQEKNQQNKPEQPQQPAAEEQQSDEDIPLAEEIETEPTTEHRQMLTKDHPLQDAPKNINNAGQQQQPKNLPNKVGAKTLYTDEVCLIVEKLASEGLTDEQIAASLGIGRRTFYEWKHKFPHFSHALNKYRGLANMYVENALFRSALGYDYTEEQVSKDGFAVEVKKHITGSVAAQKYYLNNRMPERYKNKVEQVLSLQQDIQSVAIVIKRRED